MALNDKTHLESGGRHEVKLYDFLAQFIEGYLFADLETMKAARPAKDGPDGHLGYPLVASCFAGIELLGILVSSEEFDPSKPRKNFVRYWKGFLYAESKQRASAGDSIYQLFRNGIVHNFAVKGGGLLIAKGGQDHLVLVGGNVIIDAAQLATDLQDSYKQRIKPIVSTGALPGQDAKVTTSSMQARLNQLATHNAGCVKEHGDELQGLPNAATAEISDSSFQLTVSGIQLPRSGGMP